MPRKGGSIGRIDRINEKYIQHSSAERIGICAECGKPFERIWVPSQNRYNNQKTCGSCRMAKANGFKKVTIPYSPHAAQQKIHDSEARFKILVCLPPGEFILGANKSIEDVNVDDYVFGNNRKLNKVYRKIVNDYDGLLYKINARFILPFEVTDEHPILLTKVIRNDNYKAFKKGKRPKKTIWNVEESIWVKACDVEKYLNEQTQYVKWCLKIPRLEGTTNIDKWKMRKLETRKKHYKPHFPINEKTAWLLGLYMADGSTSNCTVDYSLGTHEKGFIERVKTIYEELGYSVHANDKELDNSTQLAVCSTALAELFAKEFDTGASNKQIPQDILLHKDRNIIINFLRGYFDGDGHFDEKQLRIYGKTASRKLAYQLQLLLARLGYSAYIHENTRKEKSMIRGREINNSNPFYMVVCSSSQLINELGYSDKTKHIREFSFIKDDAIYIPLESVETREYKGKVYNLSTNDDTFLVSNIVSHNCGNRFGKDLGSIGEGVMRFIEMENEERSIDVNPPVLWWIVAPNMRLARQNWRDLKKLLPKELVYDISLSNLTIETINGGIIEIHSADDPETLVGVGLDIVTITEAARVKELDTVWANLRQRLDSPGRGPGGKGGIALINSTPRGRTYFYKLALMGDKDSSLYSPSYETFHFSTWDNPHMGKKRYTIVGEDSMGNPITFEDEIKMGMTNDRYRQDYLAEFIMEINSVFPHYDRVLIRPPLDCRSDEAMAEFWSEWEKVDPFETYTIGYDPASKGDGKPCVIRDSKGKVVKIDLMSRLGWDAQWDRLAMYSRLYNGATVNFGQTGLGETIGSQLTKRGIPNVPINEQGNNKAKLVEDFAVVVEQQWCQIPWSTEVEKQLQDYVSVDREGRSTQYHNATDSGHDDIVSALYFCFSDFQSPALLLPWVGRVGGISKSN
ncbi:LAGLIDADG family homing endonuclease [Tissierella pigra]|uniref:DOD-type homing endonuclease domain-containing protein n=1 Tax=Tissierella pigra TaxID=2607614 RepID=A0A6N7XK35_9FIRM|nr:LAGLIDADG family homing endonuclease [Tissierella pigra]MSU01946.1 hypothetical protein [Tissierella pigra]